jgi:hypothetical protein
MIDFRTDVRITPSPYPITLKTPILTAGSCFADAIGQRLEQNKFHTLTNPLGVIYNPHSIHRALRYAIHNEPSAQHLYVQHQEVHLNYDFHSRFSSTKKTELVDQLTNTIGSVHYFLKDSGWILITYGTAWVYNRVDTGEVVANCHKMPANLFRKNLMSEDAIVKSFETFYNELKSYNPNVRIILTVSPVRHTKDTLELNSVSKSVLRVACHSITQKFEDAEYFPAYEMMMDDLRDYRFYKSDLIHPTEVAEDYIWEKFAERYFDAATKNFITEWQSVKQALQHKPFHPQSQHHQQFLKETLKKLERFKSTVDVGPEIEAVKKVLRNEY